MSFTKAAILSIFAIIFFSSAVGENTDVSLGPCDCGVFEFGVTENVEPLVKQSPLNVTCDSAGLTNCIEICTALAQVSKEQAPQLLCAYVGNINNLKAAIYGRNCNETSWTHTGITTPHLLCCENGLPKACDSETSATIEPSVLKSP